MMEKCFVYKTKQYILTTTKEFSCFTFQYSLVLHNFIEFLCLRTFVPRHAAKNNNINFDN
jgi:hypothetical protein